MTNAAVAPTTLSSLDHTSDAPDEVSGLSPLSKELVFGFVGYAGTGCSTAANRLRVFLEEDGYTVHVLKLSDLILRHFGRSLQVPDAHGVEAGRNKFERAHTLQELGDNLRQNTGAHAVATLAITEIRRLRGSRRAGEEKIAFLLDSIKHSEEVKLLRRVYDMSFRLIAMHCERPKREERIIGRPTSTAKYAGVEEKDVLRYMERDEKDAEKPHGQQVREAFYLADFFVDNNLDSRDGENLSDDLKRFINLILGSGLVRPTKGERAMYHAHTAALQSSCLSRQVGAALTRSDGTIISTGTNDVPKFGGGLYDEESNPDNRCFRWEWENGTLSFSGCHNQRKKQALKSEIARWLASEFAKEVALDRYPIPDTDMDLDKTDREEMESTLARILSQSASKLGRMPGVSDLIEYSRSIHAEMNALLLASRNGISTIGTVMYCTTYPCHNCARHLVAAGVEEVRYIEPYVKSLATELHYDSVVTELPVERDGSRALKRTHMLIAPFSGVGPRMYEDYFKKRGELKREDGTYEEPGAGMPVQAVRLDDLNLVEERAAMFMDGGANGRE